MLQHRMIFSEYYRDGGDVSTFQDTSIFTVDEVRRAALPLGTIVATGGDVLMQPVRWVVAVNADSPLPYLEGQELVLIIPGKELTEMTPMIQACAERQVAAIACLPPISALALMAAESVHLPMLQLPPNSNIREVERLVMSLLLDRHGHIERRSAQIYKQLVELASENVGLDRIVHELSRYTDKAVVVQDKHLRIQVTAVTPQFAAEWDDITEFLADRQLLPSPVRDRHKLPRHTSPVQRQQIREDNLTRLIAPIINQGVGRGYLSLIAPGESFSEIDTLVLTHGAVVCALEMARAKAISEIEKKLRGDFLDSLLTGTVGEAEALAEGDRFGHDMNVPHLALVLMWYGDKHPSPRRLETLVNGMLSGSDLNVLCRLRENEVRLFYGSDSAMPIQAARQLAEDIRHDARREHPDTPLAIGIGSVAARISDWRASYREATQAADIARRLHSPTALYIGDLGIYTFLARPDYREDLRALRDSTIGNLIEYEEQQRADLLLTLEAFFQCHGNHTQTAGVLSVHRNTLFYRMNRIAEITGLDLNHPDVRLAVHLALKIHRLLTADTG